MVKIPCLWGKSEILMKIFSQHILRNKWQPGAKSVHTPSPRCIPLACWQKEAKLAAESIPFLSKSALFILQTEYFHILMRKFMSCFKKYLIFFPLSKWLLRNITKPCEYQRWTHEILHKIAIAQLETEWTNNNQAFMHWWLQPGELYNLKAVSRLKLI